MQISFSMLENCLMVLVIQEQECLRPTKKVCFPLYCLILTHWALWSLPSLSSGTVRKNCQNPGRFCSLTWVMQITLRNSSWILVDLMALEVLICSSWKKPSLGLWAMLHLTRNFGNTYSLQPIFLSNSQFLSLRSYCVVTIKITMAVVTLTRVFDLSSVLFF